MRALDRTINLPGPSDRTFIVGRSGSGKTVGALFQLALSDFDERPWIVVDFKKDSGIGKIPGAQKIALDVKLEKLEPGIYIVRPELWQSNEVENLLLRVWETEDIGLFIDEGYMLNNSTAFRSILTQGRSKKISVFFLSQRPSFIDRFVISEATFIQVFDLIDKNDKKRVGEFVPYDFVNEPDLPPFNSIWFDVNVKRLTKLAPVPKLGDIYAIFRQRMPEEQLEREVRQRRTL